MGNVVVVITGGQTLRFHLLENSRMQTALSDKALFLKRFGPNLFAFSANYVNDTLYVVQDNGC